MLIVLSLYLHRAQNMLKFIVLLYLPYFIYIVIYMSVCDKREMFIFFQSPYDHLEILVYKI